MKLISALFGSLADVFFPPLCPLCHLGLSSRGGRLCDGCAEAFRGFRLRGSACRVCGEPLPGHSHGGAACGGCTMDPPAFESAVSLYAFEGPVREAVHLLKYGRRTMLAPALGALLAGGAGPSVRGADLVVPVPLQLRRLRQRGFNQSLLLARALSERLGAPIDARVLRRVRGTRPQVGLHASQRAENVRGAFIVSGRGLEGRDVLLVDDVYTTGATARECAAALARAGARVRVLTLARAVRD